MNLRHETIHLPTSDLVQRVRKDLLRIAGPAGGPAWDTGQRAELFAHLEYGWPTGPMLAWSPSGLSYEPWYLLDGHRRTATLMSTLDEEADLVRDLSAAEPTYIPASQTTPDGLYWPVNAMMLTMRFLGHTRMVQDTMPRPAFDRAGRVASQLVRVKLTLLVLFGGTPAAVAQVCDRLLPGRVDPTLLHQIAADPDAPHSGITTTVASDRGPTR
ncbi:hypothetical protein WEI85_00445 [Actinomycetes bacterium KLBMP 9797]